VEAEAEMAKVAEKADPALWERVKGEITAGDKGGKPGQWSARKAQLAAHEYQRRGGGYDGRKSADNSLERWTEEEWGTKSGKESGETGERYLPKEAREQLSDADYRRTTAKKRADTRKGRQFSAQPEDVARETARHRGTGKAAGGRRTKAELYAEAKRRDVPGRSRMSRDELERAVSS
jgi:hypothetical protein